MPAAGFFVSFVETVKIVAYLKFIFIDYGIIIPWRPGNVCLQMGTLTFEATKHSWGKMH